MESKDYFEKVMQGYNLNGKDRSLRKYCKGHEVLATIVRMHMEHNPLNYNEAFIFYSKDYRKVKVLHYDINGWVQTNITIN